MKLETTVDLIQEVRDLIDEDNNDTLTDVRILRALNRAQDHAVSILATHYPEPYLHVVDLNLQASQTQYPIPEDAWSDMVKFIEVTDNNRDFYEVKRLQAKDSTRFKYGSKWSIPSHYIIRGRNIEFVPEPDGSYNAKLWYIRQPEKLVTPQGQIFNPDAATNRIVVDNLGSDLQNTGAEINNYANVCDGQTGEVKATVKINNRIGTTTIVIDTGTPVDYLNRTITNDLSTVVDEAGNYDISKNDYLCSVQGTCVPYFSRPVKNFILQHAAAEMKRALGGTADMEFRERDRFEKEVRGAWTGRENGMRIRKTTRQWNTIYKHYPYRTN